jgi:tetratricopeptide (TPR) repeat protein
MTRLRRGYGGAGAVRLRRGYGATGGGALVTGVTALAIVAAACSSPSPDSSEESTRASTSPSRLAGVRKVVLPDLTGMAPPVQEQLREQFTTLSRIEADAAAPPDKRAAAYGDLGKLLLATESFGDAETCFLNASELDPADTRWGYYLAHVYRLRGESQQASSYFERTLETRPDDIAALVWLGTVYLDQGRPVEAGPLFSRALALDARVAAAQVGLGRVAVAARDHAGAIAHFEAALALDRGATSVHYSLATAYRATGQIEQADAHLRQRGPGQIGPPDPLMQEVTALLRSPVTFESRGDRALARGEFARAVTEFRSGLELAPDNLALRQKLATALSLTGAVRGSLQQLQEILRRDPKFASAHYSLGALLLADGQTDLAIDRFASAVEFEPTYLHARLQLANTLRSRGQFARAREQYAAVLKLDPRFAEARFGHAIALAGLKRYAEARDGFAEGIRLHPDRVEFISSLVRLLAAAPDSGVRDGSRAVMLATELVTRQNSASAREAMAMALAEAGRYDEALQWQHDAIATAERDRQPNLARAMAANLRLFERRQPSRIPWAELPAWEPQFLVEG